MIEINIETDKPLKTRGSNKTKRIIDDGGQPEAKRLFLPEYEKDKLLKELKRHLKETDPCKI